MATKNKEQLKAEAQGAKIAFEFDGEEFEIPPRADWPLDAMEAFEEGKIMGVLKAVFGDEQYARIKDVCKTFSDLNDFLVAAMGAIGVDPKVLR